MALATGMCLALSVWLSSGPNEEAQRIRRRMAVFSADAVGVMTARGGTPERDVATTRPARMNALVADLGRAEMDLRLKRGVAMLVSMAVGMAMFIGLRALRTRPVGPVVLRLGRRDTA
jgi:hypothetical protein